MRSGKLKLRRLQVNSVINTETLQSFYLADEFGLQRGRPLHVASDRRREKGVRTYRYVRIRSEY